MEFETVIQWFKNKGTFKGGGDKFFPGTIFIGSLEVFFSKIVIYKPMKLHWKERHIGI